MTSKYDPLATYLRQQPGPLVTLTLAQIQAIIGRPLPASALPSHPDCRNWWANSFSPRSQHSQAKHGWLAAGWEVEAVNPLQGTVTFRR